MYSHLMVLCCLVAFLSPAWADDAAMMDAILFPSGHVELGNSLDDPQPDTIRYDDNTPALLNTGTNFWTRVRFNAPNNFELRSIYFYSTNGSGNAAPCSIFVHEANGNQLGTLLSSHRQPGNVGDFTWNDSNLPTPVQFQAGDSFYVVIGPVPGGAQAQGWHVIMDNANVGRSGISTAGHYGTYGNSGGDYMIRAGGAVEAFIDLEASECFNDVDGDSAFNFLPGGVVTLSAVVTNTGNSNVTLYTVEWTVNGPGGQVFNNEVAAGPINDGASQIVTADTTFVAAQDGEYLVTCTVTAENDAVPDNNTTYLRFFAGGVHRWYRYDDNQNADSYIGFSTGNGWGVSFAPTLFTAQVESIRVDVQAAGNGDFRLYMNDAAGLPTGSPVWSATPAVSAGWNRVTVNPPVPVFVGQSVTLAYLYSGIAMGKDDTPPNNAGITNMGTISYQAANDGALWEADNSGNWSMQVYFDSSSAAPPFPLIATNLDTLDFGQVDTAAVGEVITLWVYNLGTVDPLQVTGMVINPPNIRTSYSLSRTSFSVAAGDSEDVQVTFTPVGVGVYNGAITIANNSDNAPNKNIRLIGEGVAGSAADDIPSDIPLSYELSQNYPNPFNPSTEISFALPQAANVKLVVFNTLGQEIAVLTDGTMSAGRHAVTFHAADLTAGVYIYRLEAGGATSSYTAIRKMMFVK